MHKNSEQVLNIIHDYKDRYKSVALFYPAIAVQLLGKLLN
jgi:hypothetical protein